MVSMLFTVLRMIGIAILILLGVILFLLLLVLFVPVRYRGKGSYQGGVFDVRLRASWLLHMVSVKGEYQNGQNLHLSIKIFGINIYDNLKGSDQKSKNKREKSVKTRTKSTGEIQAASSGDAAPEIDFSIDNVPEDTVSWNTVSKDDWEGIGEKDYDPQSEMTTDSESQNELADNNDKEIGLFQKIKIFFINFVKFFKNIKFTFNKVCDTMVKIKDDIKYYLKMFQLDSTKRAFATCQKQLGHILKKISPRKCKINLHLGFDDPAVMGEILAVWGMLYPLHQGDIDIQPEFEQSIIEGTFSLQGCISIFVFVKAACILFFDKDIKRLIKQLKQSGSN